MNVYVQGNSSNGLELILSDREKDRETFNLLYETVSIVARWPRIELEILSNEDKLYESDFPAFWDFINSMIISERIMNILKKHEVSKKLEFLPAYCQDVIFYFVHIIGEDKCTHIYDDHYNYIFIEEEVRNLQKNKQILFNSKYNNIAVTGEVFFTDEFISYIKENAGVDVPADLETLEDEE